MDDPTQLDFSDWDSLRSSSALLRQQTMIDLKEESNIDLSDAPTQIDFSFDEEQRDRKKAKILRLNTVVDEPINKKTNLLRQITMVDVKEEAKMERKPSRYLTPPKAMFRYVQNTS